MLFCHWTIFPSACPFGRLYWIWYCLAGSLTLPLPFQGHLVVIYLAGEPAVIYLGILILCKHVKERYLARQEGFEPTTIGFGDRHSTTELLTLFVKTALSSQTKREIKLIKKNKSITLELKWILEILRTVTAGRESNNKYQQFMRWGRCLTTACKSLVV